MGRGGETVEYSEQLLVINGRPRSMHCIIARRRRQNGNNSFKISANKSRTAKLEGSRLLEETVRRGCRSGG